LDLQSILDVIVATASPLLIHVPIYSDTDLNENSETNSNTGIAQTKYHSGKYSRNFPPRRAFAFEYARPMRSFGQERHAIIIDPERKNPDETET
jgi:hypothetical protein